MMSILKALRMVTAVVIVGILAGCISVPPQSVELSRTLGNDLEALEGSYQKLIDQYFINLRQQVNRAIDDVFVPNYISAFVVDGGLVEAAKNENASYVVAWAEIAVETIAQERAKRIEPLDQAEAELSQSIEAAFARTIRANAAITAYLASQRNVRRSQDELLSNMGLQEIKDNIDAALLKASQQADNMISEIEAVAEELD